MKAMRQKSPNNSFLLWCESSRGYFRATFEKLSTAYPGRWGKNTHFGGVFDCLQVILKSCKGCANWACAGSESCQLSLCLGISSTKQLPSACLCTAGSTQCCNCGDNVAGIQEWNCNPQHASGGHSTGKGNIPPVASVACKCEEFNKTILWCIHIFFIHASWGLIFGGFDICWILFM